MKLYTIIGPLENTPPLWQNLLPVMGGGGLSANEYVLKGGGGTQMST